MVSLRFFVLAGTLASREGRALMFSIAPFLLGFSAAIAQVLILRELVTVLYGNELVFAVVLTIWLVGVGSGSAVFTFFRKSEASTERVVLWMIGLSGVLVVLTIVGARSLRSALGIPPGMLVDILPAVYEYDVWLEFFT